MMGVYSIKELEKLSGIKAHTIRIWEKRYSVIEPKRTNTNIRLYSDEDLKRIINVSLLNNNGIKISKIPEISDEEISEKILDISKSLSDTSIHINQLTVAMIDLDEEKFEKTLSALILRYDFEHTLISIVYPFLEKIGILWQTNNISPAQEHFISNLIRQKLIVAIDALTLPSSSSRKVLLFLAEKELHEIGLLFYHYLLRKAGYRTFYLGQAVPHQDLKLIYATHFPDMIVTSVTTAVPRLTIEEYLDLLAVDLPCSRILVSGFQVQHLDYNCRFDRIRLFKNVTELKSNIVNR